MLRQRSAAGVVLHNLGLVQAEPIINKHGVDAEAFANDAMRRNASLSTRLLACLVALPCLGLMTNRRLERPSIFSVLFTRRATALMLLDTVGCCPGM